MKSDEKIVFEKLKEQIVTTMQQSYPEIPDSVSDWKGQHIIDFQADLRFKLHENISEKWFYTHMKSSQAKLPRIDILNFLSKYVGCKSWDDFKLQNQIKTNSNGHDKSNRVFYLVPFITLAVLSVFYLLYNHFYTQEYTLNFYDSDSKQAISNCLIEVNVLSNNESPTSFLCDKNGSLQLKTNKREIRFVVEAPYYHADTIIRTLNSFNRTENIKLKLDDYAVMIQYFSKSNVKDWYKRRDDLDQAFAENAKIFQVMNESVGMEIYNKWDFINKLTLPTSSLRNIEIIDSKYVNGKITYLRFRQIDKKE